ncbi:AAA family ATPase [Francisella tularensis]|nr:AAA family ATPase [Francisella tularensis]MDN9003981.1 AAA family ATPase [Francisella tularensis subsp. mediasiatica]MDN9008202.1 AAA family ATPase [Francisella tularensis subsp. mediasiatica]WKL70077.1 AAA family ATPase [Francisella tularensis subsp. mediasiatica]WKL72510.1 AAA family ATPase [Francisella tularensis subsp. mediasiatica]WKL73549.1 AAA family ATPase [Francisella tularensis subsp. mediasiatica]
MKEGYSLEELRRILEVYPSNEVFEYFYNALLSEMITDIQIFFNDDNLTIGDLSEGEKKLLLLKAAFEFVAQEDSLFMLDEPDSHIHLDNKKHIIDILE